MSCGTGHAMVGDRSLVEGNPGLHPIFYLAVVVETAHRPSAVDYWELQEGELNVVLQEYMPISGYA